MNKPRLIKGDANPELADKIAQYLDLEFTSCTFKQFADGEYTFQINESVRGKDVYIIQSTHPPVDNYFKLFLMIDTAKRASAGRIVAVIPYFGYARQDRKDKPRVPITAKLMANLITRAGADRVLTIDLHAPQIQGFFDIPVDNLLVDRIFKNKLDEYGWLKKKSGLVVVSPDIGGAKLCEPFIKVLGLPFVEEGIGPDGKKRIESSLAITYKVRYDADLTKVVDIIGRVRGKKAILRDDIIDTGGSLTNSAEMLHSKGVDEIVAFCTHPILAGPAVKRISESSLKKLFVTDTIPINKEKRDILKDKLEIVSVAPLLGEAIKTIHQKSSISVLFSQKE